MKLRRVKKRPLRGGKRDRGTGLNIVKAGAFGRRPEGKVFLPWFKALRFLRRNVAFLKIRAVGALLFPVPGRGKTRPA